MDRMERMRRPLRTPETGGGSSGEYHEESDFDRLARMDEEAGELYIQQEAAFLSSVKAADPDRQKQLALKAIEEGDGLMVMNNPDLLEPIEYR